MEKYRLCENKVPLLVGFSGGADSLCLLHILYTSGLNIVALHLNHNWRGEESLRDYTFCREFCLKNNIEFYSETLPDSVPHTEIAAREARYAFFECAAEKFGAQYVFTAHNADDNAETVLYRIIKGTGIDGLSGIKEQRGIFYRPLLSVSRKEIEEYCEIHHLTPVTDSSNNDTKYKRNFIRHELLPLMKTINKDVVDSLNSLSQIASEDNAIVNEYLEDALDKIGTSTKTFVNCSQAVQNRIIYNLFKINNIDYDRERILNTVEFINRNALSKSGKTLSVTKDLWMFASEEEFYLISSKKYSKTEINITTEGIYEFDNFIFSLNKTETIPAKFPADSECLAYASFNEINFTLRYRHGGDIIYPLGSGGSQKLKKFFNSKKVPNHKKDSIPLLCRQNEVLWAAGYGISENIKVENQPFYVLKLSNKDEVGYGN